MADSEINPHVMGFITLPLNQAYKLVRCGFELETQSFSDKTMECFYNRPRDMFNRKRWEEDRANALVRYKLRSNDLADFLYQNPKALKQVSEKYFTTEQQLSVNSNDCKSYYIYMILRDLELNGAKLVGKLTPQFDKLFEKYVVKRVRENIRQRDYMYHKVQHEHSFFKLAAMPRTWSSSLIAERDGTVKGPEIKTKGPRKTNQFLLAARNILKNKINVDTTCSFHIHLSLHEVDHDYDEDFQLAAYQYILYHMDQVPASVKRRWSKAKWRQKFFPMRETYDRYAFVAHRPSYNTWEFRCWGNISKYEDSATALELSIKAMRYAYAVTLGLQELYIPKKRFTCQLRDNLLNSGKSLKTHLAEATLREHAKQQEALLQTIRTGTY